MASSDAILDALLLVYWMNHSAYSLIAATIHASHELALARTGQRAEIEFDKVLTWYRLKSSRGQIHDISRDL